MERQARFGEPVEATEDREAEAVVDEVAFADQFPVLIDLLDITFHRTGEKGVGKPLAGDRQCSVSSCGEERVSTARGISAGDAHPRFVASLGDDGGFGQRFAEEGDFLSGPAVVPSGRYEE